MKKVIVSFLLCFGVGLTLMGGPVQVSDDNNTQVVNYSERNGPVTTVADQPQNPVHHGNGRIKYEFKKMVISPSTLSAPKIMIIGKSRKVQEIQARSFECTKGIMAAKHLNVSIIHDPVPRPINPHTNSDPSNPKVSLYSVDPNHPTSTR